MGTVSNSQLPGCNSVDIGAQIGDTTLNLAAVFPGGTVTAFEMGPPIDILRVNVRSDRRIKYGLLSVLNWFNSRCLSKQIKPVGQIKSSVADRRVATFDEMKFDSCYLIDL